MCFVINVKCPMFCIFLNNVLLRSFLEAFNSAD